MAIIILLLGVRVNAQIKNRFNPVNDTTVYEYDTQKQIAQFKGGTSALFKFIEKNLKWPESAGDSNGRVLISFIVEKNGTLTNFKIERGMGQVFDAEALRVIKRSPKWIPAKIKGERVRSRYIVPIRFDIQ